jgi:hypothetical protein
LKSLWPRSKKWTLSLAMSQCTVEAKPFDQSKTARRSSSNTCPGIHMRTSTT